MASTKRLRSVIQSTAHHSMSGLCYVLEHLREFCEERGLDRASIDLLTGKVVTSAWFIAKPLRLSAKALGERFAEILDSEGMKTTDLRSATIEFHFRKGPWCHLKVETVDENYLEDTYNKPGRRAKSSRTPRRQ